ncbi:putative reverse transcriptase domain-containing protein, partial [Tanacetum coccineum]
DDMSGYIVGISKPSNKEPGIEITEGLVLDAELLDCVFKVPITTVKCIPHGCRLAYSQALKTALCKVVAQPDSIDAWVRLLLFPRCTLQSLATWGKYDGIATLVKSILDGSALRSFGQGGAEINSVFCCIKSFPKGTSCGRDGLRAQHILDALCEEGSATATDLLKVITSVVNLWLAGRCPPILAEFVTSVPPTPLLKLDNEIRPIAVGTIWRRLVSKVAMKGMGKEMSNEYHNDGSLAMLTMDFSNAFNLVDRSTLLHEVRVKCPSISLWVDFLYGQASRLYIGDTHIWSATEVQQGDPLGPLLFALILHPLLHKIKDSCKLLLHVWYLDDGTVIGDSEEVARVLDIIKRSSSGVKLFGGALSRDADFISVLAMRRAANAVDLMSLLPQLHDSQSFRGLIKNIVVCGGPFFGDLQWRLASLPIRFGGLGLYSAKLVSSYAFVASMVQS